MGASVMAEARMVLTIDNYLETRQSPRTGWIPTGKLTETERKRISIRQDAEHLVLVLGAHLHEAQIDPATVRFQLSSGGWFSIPEFLESMGWKSLEDGTWHRIEPPVQAVSGQLKHPMTYPSTMRALKGQLPPACEEGLSEITHVEFLP